jgi:RNA polymerase sigma-70 factor (ECF subfamily)
VLVNDEKVMHLTAIRENAVKPGLDPLVNEDFAELVRMHHRDLLIYAYALVRDDATAQDIVQDSFVAAYEKAGAFDITRDFATWMRGIVRNKWREWIRKNRRYQLSDDELASIDAEVAAWQTSRANEDSPIFEALETCLSRLPENLRKTVNTYYFEGNNGNETATCFGVAPAAIRKRLQRARILLKQCLDRKLELSANSGDTCES